MFIDEGNNIREDDGDSEIIKNQNNHYRKRQATRVNNNRANHKIIDEGNEDNKNGNENDRNEHENKDNYHERNGDNGNDHRGNEDDGNNGWNWNNGNNHGGNGYNRNIND